MTSSKLTNWLLGTALILAAALGTTAEAIAAVSGVSGVQVRSGKLMVSAGGETYLFEGTYEASKGRWVNFESGKAVALAGEDGRKTRILKTEIENGRVLFSTDSGRIQLGDGEYSKQNPTQPRDPEPQPRPNPNAFKVSGGKIVSMTVGDTV